MLQVTSHDRSVAHLEPLRTTAHERRTTKHRATLAKATNNQAHRQTTKQTNKQNTTPTPTSTPTLLPPLPIPPAPAPAPEPAPAPAPPHSEEPGRLTLAEFG